MAAVRWNITLSNGRTFTLRVACKVENDDETIDVRDLTGWTGAMQIRETADADAVLATADVEIDTVTGIVTATITDADTEVMTWRSGVYDLIITDGTETDTLAEGSALFRRSVTR